MNLFKPMDARDKFFIELNQCASVTINRMYEMFPVFLFTYVGQAAITTFC